MFIKTNVFMGELKEINCFVSKKEVDEFYLHAKVGDGFEIVTIKKTEQELNDFMEDLTDAVENGQGVFRE